MIRNLYACLVAILVLGAATFLVACSGSSKTGVEFHAKAGLSTDRTLEVEVANHTLSPVHIHERDYLFSVTCKDASGAETLIRPDPTIEWQAPTAANGTLVRPGESVVVTVSFRNAPASLVGCVPSQVEYTWP